MSGPASGPAPGASPGTSDVAAAARHHARGAELGRDRGLAVLLVEDSPLLAERLCEALGAMPAVAHVRTVDRETAAVGQVGGHDVVVLDLHLKQGSGFGVLRALRARDGRPPIVIVFTNHDVPGYRARAAALGAQHFLDKARDFDRLGDLLREIHLQRARVAHA